MSTARSERPAAGVGALAGLKADLSKCSQRNECGCTLRRWGVTSYIMAAPSCVSDPLPYEIDDAALCEAWEAFLVEHSPIAGKDAKANLELLSCAEWRSGLWLNDGARAREQGNDSLAKYCYERCQYWLDRANQIAEGIA